MMKVLVSGLCGHMGAIVARLCLEGYAGTSLVGGVDIHACGAEGVPCATTFDKADTSADVIVDFSHHSCTNDLLRFAVSHKIPLVIATTGQTDEEKAAIRDASAKIPLFFAANYSLGIALLADLAKKTAAAMPDAEIEIIEKHHDRKLDAPSGTALSLAAAICEVRPHAYVHTGRQGYCKRTPDEIGIHAVRIGNVVGDHEIIIGTPTQTITLKHEAHDRALFAEGALRAAAFLADKPAGLYTMQDLLRD